MKPTERLLDDSETSAFARSLLAAGRRRAEPAGSHDRVWTSLAATLPVVGVGARSWVDTAKTKLLLATAVTVTGAGIAVATLRLGVPPAKLPEPATAPIVAPLQAPSALVASAADLAPPPRQAVTGIREARKVPRLPLPRPVLSSRVETAAPAHRSSLGEEAALLQGARSALVRGDLAGAHAALDEAERRFPASQLAEERDALRVRLARDSGDQVKVAALARKFVEHYPNSPLRPRVESMARASENQ
jgi:hypothetical protein